MPGRCHFHDTREISVTDESNRSNVGVDGATIYRLRDEHTLPSDPTYVVESATVHT